jgi:hypothetical protein
MVKSEILLKTSIGHKGKSLAVNLSTVDILPTLISDFRTSPSLEEYTIYSNLTPAGSPDYVSCKSEEPSPRISDHPSLAFPSHEEVKDSLLVFQNPLYNTPFPYAVVPMAATGGGGGGVFGGGGVLGGGGAPGGA